MDAETECPRVEQTKLHNPPESTGNCFSAVLAGLLRLPIEQIPDFDGLDWKKKLNAWLANYGLAWAQLEDIKVFHVVFGIKGLWHEIAGASPRDADVLHAVAGRDGEIAWDPHPSQAGLSDTSEGCGVFLSLRPWEATALRFELSSAQSQLAASQAEVARLTAEVEKLRNALTPFAAGSCEPPHATGCIRCNARSALAPSTDKKEA